ncbi:MAG: efflux RND transporter periplasmic adaptor subunit [Gammaproteobacteria bacterium]|nr:efflux RND transporter periplasmic adaptor subunit [Gammaproteobacteria bacterium]
MKLASLLSLTLVLGFALGYGAFAWLASQEASSGAQDNRSATNQREILYWVAPMDANFRRDKPGKSPMGMDLVPVYADQQDSQADAITIEPSVVQNLGVRTAPVTYGPLVRQIDTVGYVEYDENALQHIHTRVDGWVEKLSVKAEGDPVKAGETLFELYSRTLTNAQQEFLLAKKASQSALRSAASERLLTLGMTTNELTELDQNEVVKERIKVVSTATGVVTMLGVREGVYVTPSTHVMSIADLERVWILAEVMERHADAVKIGQDVVFEVDAKPGQQYVGEVGYIYPDLDPVTRSMKVRIAFTSNNAVLRPNMLARVSIAIPSDGSFYSVPTSAVIHSATNDRVVQALGNGRFKSIEVLTGFEAGDRTAILTGLQATDRVVVSGQFLIDSESNTSTSLARLETAALDP